MNRLHKVFLAPEIRLYALGADQMDRAAELFQTLMDMSKVIQGGTERYGSTMETISAASDLYKRIRFKLEVLPRFARLPQSLPDMFTDADLTPALLEAWREYYFGCQMLVGSFNRDGQAFLFYIEGNGEVQNFTFPGFAAIGSGHGNAMFWLSYRNHNLGFSIRRSAYHAFEAKIMAESSPHVNEKLDMLIAHSDKWSLISDDLPAKGNTGNAPISIQELKEMFAKYGPKVTDEMK
jgi:hypothetical protein